MLKGTCQWYITCYVHTKNWKKIPNSRALLPTFRTNCPDGVTFFLSRWGQSGGWGLINTHSCPQLWCSKKNSNSNTAYWTLVWVFRADKTSTLHCSGGRVQVWVQVLAPANQCQSSGNHSKRLFMKTIWGFNCKINGKALGAALQQSLGGFDRHEETQGGSKSAAVAAGSDQLAWGKHATTLAILTQFDS